MKTLCRYCGTAKEDCEKLEENALMWARIAGAHQQQIKKLVDEIENLMCCGNCLNGKPELNSCNKQKHGKYCNRYTGDTLNRLERMSKINKKKAPNSRGI